MSCPKRPYHPSPSPSPSPGPGHCLGFRRWWPAIECRACDKHSSAALSRPLGGGGGRLQAPPALITVIVFSRPPPGADKAEPVIGTVGTGRVRFRVVWVSRLHAGQRTGDGGWRTEDGRRGTADGGQGGRTGWRTGDGVRRTADGGRRKRREDSGRMTADEGRRTGKGDGNGDGDGGRGRRTGTEDEGRNKEDGRHRTGTGTEGGRNTDAGQRLVVAHCRPLSRDTERSAEPERSMRHRDRRPTPPPPPPPHETTAVIGPDRWGAGPAAAAKNGWDCQVTRVTSLGAGRWRRSTCGC